MLFPPPPLIPISFQSLIVGNRPNRHLVAPPDLCAVKPDRTAPRFAMSVTDLFAKLCAVIESGPRTERRAVLGDGLQGEWLVRSAILGFPDSVTAAAIPMDDGGATVAIYSRSTYGYSDLGANRKRVEAWLRRLEADTRKA